MIHEKHKVVPLSETVRLSEYLPGKLKNIYSRKGVKKAIKRGQVFVNGRIASTGDYLLGGEEIELRIETEQQNTAEFDLPLDVLYEDDHLALINKPPGILVSGNKRRTIKNALSKNIKPGEGIDRLVIPETIHRLDYPTSGVLLIGKTRKTATRLYQLFSERKIEKCYLAVSTGEMKNEGEIVRDIDGKQAITQYNKLNNLFSDKYGALNLLKLKPETGRRHQIRKHLAGIDHPVFGDHIYSGDHPTSKGSGLYLHAYSLKFIHPETGEQVFIEAPVSKKFYRLFPDNFNTDHLLISQ